MALEPGTQIGRFRITRLIAQGGMAEVYRAEQELAGGILRPTALKVIRPEYSESTEFREMFLDEARLACTLSHPNIVHIYEVGETDGRLFMAMELVPGESLAFVSRELREKNERFSDEALLAIGIFTCSALEMVHTLRVEGQGHVNLVHRDVSPHNLLLGPNGSLKLIDFGIAKATTNRNLTSAGVTKGKAGYFSPEQAMGRALDGRSDLFSLGVTLYKLAWGATPFDAHKTHHDRNTALVHGRWRPLREVCPGLPEGFYDIVGKSLQVHPDHRFIDATEMRFALETLALESGIHVGPSTLGGYVQPQADDLVALGSRPQPGSARHARQMHQPAHANAATFIGGAPGPAAGVTAQAPATGMGATRASPNTVMTSVPQERTHSMRPAPTAGSPTSTELDDGTMGVSLSSPGKPRHTERLAPRSGGPQSLVSIEVQRTQHKLLMISGGAIVFIATVVGLIIGGKIATAEDSNAPESLPPVVIATSEVRPVPERQVVVEAATPPRTVEAPAPAPAPATKVSTRPPAPAPAPAKKDPPRSTKNSEVLAARTPVELPEPGAKTKSAPVADEPTDAAKGDGKLRVGGPEDAQVEVNGKRWGMSPLDRKVPPGTYAVVVRSIDGRKELSRTVEVKSDKATMVRFDLAKGVISSSN